MDVLKKKWKKNVFAKAFMMRRSKSINLKQREFDGGQLSKSRSCPASGTTSPQVNIEKKQEVRRRVPHGCFPVYVGPKRVRFVVKTKYANHPLFLMLLEDAELEYGYISEGPLVLPCDEDLFVKILAEIDETDDDQINQTGSGCGMSAAGGYSPLTPSRLLRMNHF